MAAHLAKQARSTDRHVIACDCSDRVTVVDPCEEPHCANCGAPLCSDCKADLAAEIAGQN